MISSVSVRAKVPRLTRSTGHWKRLLATHLRLSRHLNALVMFTWPISIAARRLAFWDGKQKWTCKRELRRPWISSGNKKGSGGTRYIKREVVATSLFMYG